MKNLIIGAAVGYTVEDLKPFVLSLRKHYNDYVMFIVEKNTEKVQKFFDDYNIQSFEMNLDDGDLQKYRSNKGLTVQSKRYKFYLDILKNKFLDVDKILLTDVRDVVFQKGPFDHEMTTELEFFYERKLLKDCNCHKHWYVDLNIYGSEVYREFGDNHIICSGTTIGKRESIISYLNELVREIQTVESKLNRPITDQPSHQYLIYKNVFDNYKCYHPKNGPIITLESIDGIRFDENNNILNDDDSIIAVVHQWDRVAEKNTIYNKAIS